MIYLFSCSLLPPLGMPKKQRMLFPYQRTDAFLSIYFVDAFRLSFIRSFPGSPSPERMLSEASVKIISFQVFISIRCFIELVRSFQHAIAVKETRLLPVTLNPGPSWDTRSKSPSWLRTEAVKLVYRIHHPALPQQEARERWHSAKSRFLGDQG